MPATHEPPHDPRDPQKEPGRLTLRVRPDPVLREKCAPVEHFGPRLVDLCQRMLVLMQDNGGIGLAAPQAGIPQRFFVAQIAEERLFVVNPVLEYHSGREDAIEGCLSLPGSWVAVDRASAVDLVGFDPRGFKLAITLRGLWARLVQHETDHLDGTLICDLGPEVQRTPS